MTNQLILLIASDSFTIRNMDHGVVFTLIQSHIMYHSLIAVFMSLLHLKETMNRRNNIGQCKSELCSEEKLHRERLW